MNDPNENLKLDAEERELLDSYDRGEWRSVSNQGVAMRELENVNVSLSRVDLETFKSRAAAQGRDPKSLISDILHRYAMGKLTERSS